MPRSAHHDEESESRTASVGAKRSHSRRQGQVNSSLPHSAVESASASESSSDHAVMGTILSHPVEQATWQEPEPSTSSDHHEIEADMNSTSQGLGNNRLATGFRKPRPTLSGDSASAQSARDSPSEGVLSSAESLGDVVEISSDEDESSDGGGMVINLDSGIHSDTMVIDDEEEEEDEDEGEEGEISEDEAVESHPHKGDASRPLSSPGQAAHQQLQAELEQVASAFPTSYPTPPEPAHPRRFRTLADLTPEELERQLKYALFDLDHDHIDLDRPAVCLGCLQEGHTEESCPEKTCVYCAATGEHSSRLCPQVRRCSKCRERGHISQSCPAGLKVTTIPCDLCGALGHHEEACPQRFFPFETTNSTGSLELWVSCCICASKSHLVGDCPEADRATTTRWSLKSFAPSQIVNLSLEPGTKQREIQASNRGLRPDGLRIRGRAGFHTAGLSGSGQPSDDDSDEQFLHPRVPNRNNSSRNDFTFRHSQRLPGPPSRERRDNQYDRFQQAPDHRGFHNRPPNNWYSTDSFGHPTPRSPPSTGGRNDDQWSRGADLRRRSRSPRGFDGYRARQRRSPSPRYRGGTQTESAKASDHPVGFRGGPSSQPRPGVAIQLPVRRGSNNLLNQRPFPRASENSGPAQPTSGKERANFPKKKKSKKGKVNA
ncbi:hypothetical protein A1O1_05462 [Capronia coronata CBS 617.96]|uniref:CCHC-type domain-containing protein n=1 Tax=Capronia coronata CBS 617.96 TaxID=1182541 RepID=W9Y6S3_9EURO|nr:uncharacterized protein A1O1_05462 [Capronia coronata CBS 617.96]EXJ88532.1 hypothetical protein A1O1_05462 [Capronia coronata CBS 617.96]